MPYNFGDKNKNEANLLKDILSVDLSSSQQAQPAKIINISDYRK